MKIRTNEELFDKLDSDLAWRKKEISFIINSFKSAKNDDIRTYYKRIGITFLYAHWEGFIKNASIYYLNFLRNKKIPYEQLTPNLITISLKNKITECSYSKKTSIRCELVNFLLNNLSEISKIPDIGGIDAQSNLNYNILYEILFTLGLDNRKFELKKNMIDEILLKYRNEISHGRFINLNENELLDTHKDVLEMLESFKDLIIDSVDNKKYILNT